MGAPPVMRVVRRLHTMNDVLRDEIIAEITAAFSGVARGDTTLHEADIIDRCGPDSARRAARARDAEKRWQDVPDTDIEQYPSALSHLCPESFRYYIAAYMVWSLRHYRTSGSASSDFTIYALAPNTNKPKDKRALSRFENFSTRQAQAIRRFLEFMVEHGDGLADDAQASLALDAYWYEHTKVA
ncbi:MAG: hypothetical protein C5B50_25730 [Verrucomicrobia bacterium]|nr:MAG: hypothetical protein C5B50_25730 [Verrucomicrobiota bacterium]